MLSIYLLAVVGLLAGLYMLRNGKSINTSNNSQISIGMALVIIFVIFMIILVIAWAFGIWWPGMFLGAGVASVGEALSEATGGWYPTKNVRDLSHQIQEGWKDVSPFIMGV